MTPDEARRQWYQEMAELFAPTDGRRVFWTIMRNLTKEKAARLAGRFGRLALGQTHGIEIPLQIALPEDAARVLRENLWTLYDGREADR